MWIVRAVLIFKRGAVANKVVRYLRHICLLPVFAVIDGRVLLLQKFNSWIDEQWEKSTQTALGVYPEGHRSTDGKSLPLKRGMLHYAYDRQIPVQIVIGGNKEAILSEKKMNVGFGQTVTVGYSGSSDKFIEMLMIYECTYIYIYNLHDSLQHAPVFFLTQTSSIRKILKTLKNS